MLFEKPDEVFTHIYDTGRLSWLI